MTDRSDVGLGPSFDAVLLPGDVWYGGTTNLVSPQYGDVGFDLNGHKRIWATTAAALTAGEAISVDDNGNAAAATGGTYSAPVAVPAGASFWAKQTAN